MKVIITGVTGSIGMALIAKMLKENVEMLLICRSDSKRVSNIPTSPLIKVIYSDLANLKSIENKNNEKYDVLYHLAWDGTTGIKRNDMYIQNKNVKYTLDAVYLAKRFNCDTFIGAGSQAEYGLCDRKLTSKTKTNPFTGYGMAKLCAGLMSRKLAHDLGIKHIWPRFLSVYGPYDSDTSLLMSLLSSIYNNETMDLTKGEQLWDYIYSEDVAEILYLLPTKGIDGKIYVVGSGKTKTIKEYVEKLMSYSPKDVKVNFGAKPYQENQIMYLCADNKELLKDLDYKMKYDFNTGIKKLIDWYFNQYKK